MWRLDFSLLRALSSRIANNNIPLHQRLVRAFAKGSCELQGGHLKSRSLIRVTGADSRPFLQGLITNDIGHLQQSPEEGSTAVPLSLYTLLLNHQGRVLLDALIYTQGPHLLIDCHASLKDKLIRHLKLFRVKKAVEIESVEDLSVWVIYHAPSSSPSSASFSEEDECCAQLTPGGNRKREQLPLQQSLTPLTYGDPRLPELGWRLVLPTMAHPPAEVKVMEERSYRQLRYSLGVAEGPEELLFGSSFPLESNGDYLHGVSFQKGCYIGQELTARTHHTGVVRKRLMPFRLEEGGQVDGEVDKLEIINDKGKSVGKVRGIEGQFGIALIRVDDAAAASKLTLKDGGQVVSVSRPQWWPLQASKEVHSGSRK